MDECKSNADFGQSLHPVYLLNSLLKLKESDYLCDITLVVNGRRLRCHKLILVAESHYFKAMFDSHMIESQQKEISMNGIDYYALEAVINYFYTSKINLTEDNICDIIEVVDLLQIASIHPLCDKFLNDWLELSNCISIYSFALKHGYFDVSNKAFLCALENFDLIFEEDDFLQATFNVVFKIFSSEYLNVICENHLCYINDLELCLIPFIDSPTFRTLQAIRCWVNNDITVRQKYLPDLFQILNLEKINDWIPLNDVDNCLINLGLIDKDISRWLTSKFTDTTVKTSKNVILELCFAIGGLTFNCNNEPIPLRTIEVLHKNGGWRLDKPNSFDLYEAVSTMVHCRYFSAVASSEKVIYVIGGNDGTGPISSVECYKNNEWVVLPSLPHGLESAAAVYVNKRIYVTGGFNQNIGICNKVWFYEEGFKSWHESTPMLHKRSNHCLIAVNGIIYAIGGSGENGDAIDKVECFYTWQDFWFEAASLLTPRSHLACVVYNNGIFAICGKSSEPLCTIERYDLILNNWQFMDKYTFSGSRYAHGATVLHKHLLLIGGKNSKRNSIDDVHKLNLFANTNIWHEASKLMRPRMGFGLATIKFY